MIDGIPVYCAVDKIVDIEKIVPNPRNPNQHSDSQIELLAKIIKAQGWRAPITVSNRSGLIVRGHGRMMAARKLGLTKVPVDYQDYANEAEEWADLIADNRIAELAEINNRMLMDLIEEIDTGDFDLSLTGYSDADLKEIIDSLTEPWSGEIEEDDVPEPPEIPVTKLGDIWIMGQHRLMCGDTTDAGSVEKLMAGSQADFVFTDPPWNVNYGAIEKDNAQGYKPRTILNDSMGTAEFKDFMSRSFRNMNLHSKDGCMTYVVMSAQEWGSLMLAMAENGYHWSSTIIWNKDHAVLSRKDYHTKYEPIWYGWKEGKARLCPLVDRKQNDVWDINRPTKSEEHPTMKPVTLVARAITNSSRPGGLVLDLFGGSGTTLIAAEQTGRKCCMMELDPKYCDVIIQRWENLTGLKGVVQGA